MAHERPASAAFGPESAALARLKVLWLPIKLNQEAMMPFRPLEKEQSNHNTSSFRLLFGGRA